MWKWIVAAALALLVLGALTLSDEARPRADFAFINRGDIATLDPQKMSWLQDLRVGRSIYEGLVRFDTFSPDLKIVPGVAERWSISPDGLRYTFNLRASARWSNGAPVTAHDFVYTWRRALYPETGSDYTQMFQLIKGGREFYRWRAEHLKASDLALVTSGASSDPGRGDRLWQEVLARFDALVGLKAPDDHTLVVELERPVPYFLDLCALAIFCPIYPPLVDRFEHPNPRTGRLEQTSGWTKAGVLISNGPFTLSSWRFKRDMSLVKNPHYWNAAAIALDTIDMPSIEDPNAQVLAFRTGGVDWITDTTPDYRSEMLEQKADFYREHAQEIAGMRAQGLDPVEIDRLLPSDPRNHIHAFPTFGTYFYNFNCSPRLADGRENPFRDPRVRKAFALAIDKDRIVSQVRRIGEPVASTIIPPGSIPGYVSPKGLTRDPEMARRLLAEAGYPGGRGFITVEILFTKDSGHDKVAQSIKKDWEETLGVSVTLEQRERKVFGNDLKNQNYMVSRAGWFGDYNDPTTFLDISREGSGNNDRKYFSQTFEDLMHASDLETDRAKRLALLAQAERLLVEDDLPVVPIYQYVEVYLFDAHRFTGISSHARQEQNLYLIDVFGDSKGSDTPRRMAPQTQAPQTQAPQTQAPRAEAPPP